MIIARTALLGAAWMFGAASAWAQGIRIQTPELPPRASATTGGPAPGQAAGPAQGMAQGAPQPQTAPSSHGAPAPAQQGGAYGQGAATAAPRSPATASPMQARRATQGAAVPGHGSQPYGAAAYGPAAAAPAPAMVPPTPSTPGGTCRVQPSPDRQTLSLLGPDGLARRHVPLGDFRSQLVVHSPDGQWAVAITKLRGETRYGALALDLAKCETRNTIDLPAAADDVRFEAGVAMIRLTTGEHRLPLADPGVR